MIEVTDFSKCYDNFLAVDQLSFQVSAGAVLALIGPNGAGKTTTLRSINGIVPITSGSISVDGFDLSESPIEVKKRTAYVPDDPQLFEDLTVDQHLRFQASVYGIADPWDEIARLLETFELADKRNAAASSLSRGMRQKLAICCAYLQRPKALLLDEPMTGLDPQGIRVLKETIREHAEQGVAVVISSHMLAMVEDVCSHVLVMDGGQTKFFGSLAEFNGTERNQTSLSSCSMEQAFFNTIDQAQTTIADHLKTQTTVSNPVALVSEE